MKLLPLALAFLLAPTASHAALMSGQDLITACSGEPRAKATCDGYLMAVTDIVLRRESRGHTGGKVCVPDTVTQEQVRDAVLNVAQRPRAAHAPSGAGLVLMALRATWPCPGADGAPGRGVPPQDR
jgi:hypothetical protein